MTWVWQNNGATFATITAGDAITLWNKNASGNVLVLKSGASGTAVLTVSGTGIVLPGTLTASQLTLTSTEQLLVFNLTGDGAVGTFNFGTGHSVNAGNPLRDDHVVTMGYNTIGSGGRSVSAEPSYYWAVEDYYNPSGTAYLESYYQYFAPGSNNGYRPFGVQIDRTNATSYQTNATLSMKGSMVTFKDMNDVTRLTMSGGDWFFGGAGIYLDNAKYILGLRQAGGGIYRQLIGLNSGDWIELDGQNTNSIVMGAQTGAITYSGSSTTSAKATIYNTGSDVLTLSTGGSASILNFALANSTPVPFRFAAIGGVAVTATAGAEAGAIKFMVALAGANITESARVGAGFMVGTTTDPGAGNVAAAAYKTTTALVTAVDGGSTAAFTANMVGSTGGPVTAAQNGWQKFKDSTGATVWVPVWK